MPEFTIYALGDVNSFWTMLNGIAMFFGDNGFIQAAALAGGLITLVLTLVGMLSKVGGTTSSQSPVMGPFYIGALFVLMSIPSTVLVEDIYTGSVIKVDNIPIVISIPASLFTTGAYKIFKSTDTVFQSVDGSYMSVSSNGLVTPLRLLMSLRKGLSNTAPVLAMNIKVFAKDCVTSSPTFLNGMSTAPDSLSYLLDNGNPTSLTFDFPVDAQSPVAVNCEQEAAILKDRASKFLGGTVLSEGDVNKMVNTNMARMGSVKIDPTQSYSIGDANDVVTSIVTNHLGAAAGNAQVTMSNLIMYDVIKTGLACAGTSASAEAVSACWATSQSERTAEEQWKTDAAGAGSMFSKLMVPAIVFMQLMFYGFSPIILICALFMGGKSLGLVAKYMMFGVWTISWLPFAAVIQMYIQNQVADRITQLGKGSDNGVVYSNASDFYNIVSVNLGLASDLLAATPMMSFALLSGSAMAMTSMAGRWGGRDYTDEKSLSPAGMSNGALVQNAPVMQMSQAGQQYTGSVMPSISTAGSVSNAVSSSSAEASQASSNFQKTMGDVHTAMNSKGNDWKVSSANKSDFNTAYDNSTKQQESLARSLAQTLNIDRTAAAELIGGGTVALASPSAFGASAGLKGGVGMSTKESTAKATKWAIDNKESLDMSQTFQTKLARSAENATSHSHGGANNTSMSETFGVSDAISKMKSTSEAFQTASSRGDAFAMGISGNVNELAGDAQKPGRSNMTDAVMTGYSGGDSPYSQYAAAANGYKALLKDKGVSDRNAAIGGMMMSMADSVNRTNGGDETARAALQGMVGVGVAGANPDANRGVAGTIADNPNAGEVRRDGFNQASNVTGARAPEINPGIAQTVSTKTQSSLVNINQDAVSAGSGGQVTASPIMASDGRALDNMKGTIEDGQVALRDAHNEGAPGAMSRVANSSGNAGPVIPKVVSNFNSGSRGIPSGSSNGPSAAPVKMKDGSAGHKPRG